MGQVPFHLHQNLVVIGYGQIMIARYQNLALFHLHSIVVKDVVIISAIGIRQLAIQGLLTMTKIERYLLLVLIIQGVVA